MQTSSRERISAGFIVAIAWFGIIVQYFCLTQNAVANGLTKPEAAGRFFSYFTILSNLMAAISTSAFFLAPGSVSARFFKKPFIITAVAVYILMVGIGYNVLLRQLWNPQGWQRVTDEVVHVIDPILYVLYWYFFIPKNSLRWKNALQWLAVPALYFAFTLIRGAIDGFYPYTFLDPKILGYGRMLLNAAAVGIAFIVAGLLFIKLGQLQTKKQAKTA